MGIELTREEIDRYLDAAPRGILCISRGDRAPLALPMWFAWHEGKIVITTALASKKMAALRAHPDVSFLVDSGDHYWTLKAVLIVGTCHVIDDQTEARAWHDRLHDLKPLYKNLFPETLPPHLQRFYDAPRAILTITPKSITSWDFAKVRH